MYNLRIRLECEVEFCTSQFFVVFSTESAIVFVIRSEGLHNAEFSILSKYIVNTYAPRFNVIELTKVSPRASRTAEEGTVFSVDVFNPDVPGFRLSHVSLAIHNSTNPYFRIAYIVARCCTDTIAVNAFIVSENIPLGTDIPANICAPQIISINSQLRRVMFSTRTTKLVIINTYCRIVTEEGFDFTVTSFHPIYTIIIIACKLMISFKETIVTSIFLKFTITSRYSNAVVLIFQFSAVKYITVLIAIGTSTAEIICSVTAEAEVPVRTAEVVINFQDISCNIAVFTSRTIVAEGLIIGCQANRCFNAVVDLSLATKADTIIPRSIVVFSTILVTITETSVASEFDVADFVFEVRYANAEVVQFVSIFISQFVDQSALFNGSFVHVSHSFRYHFSSFITGDVALALEVGAINALDDACVSQFYYGFVRPAVRRYVNKRVSCECTRCAYCHRCCQCC